MFLSTGDSTSISDKTKITKNFENNQKINRSMMVDSINKLVNNITQDVIQNNSSSAAAAVGASNTLRLNNIKCDEVTISGIDQKGKTDVNILATSQQANTSKISTEIATSIDKKIEKVGGTDLAELEAANTKQLNDFMNAVPGYDPNKAQRMASECPKGGGSFISANNSCDVSSSYELDSTIKKKLELDESFKINDNDDIKNEIKTKIEQTNFASCQANATSQNSIILENIQCGLLSAVNEAKKEANNAASGKPVKRKLTVSDVQQDAVSKLYMTCVFDQKSISDISNKIVNSISKKYNQIYDAVNKKGKDKDPKWLNEKLDFLDTFSAAGVEKIMAAAGNLPKKSVSSTFSSDSSPSSDSPTKNMSSTPSSDSPTKNMSSTPSSDSPKIETPSSLDTILLNRKGFANEPEKSSSDRLDEFRSKQIKLELDRARKIKEEAEKESENIKQKSLDNINTTTNPKITTTTTNPKTTTSTNPKTTTDSKTSNPTTTQTDKWLLYGGIILVIIIIIILIVILFKSKPKLIKKKYYENYDEEDN